MWVGRTQHASRRVRAPDAASGSPQQPEQAELASPALALLCRMRPLKGQGAGVGPVPTRLDSPASRWQGSLPSSPLWSQWAPHPEPVPSDLAIHPQEPASMATTGVSSQALAACVGAPASIALLHQVPPVP